MIIGVLGKAGSGKDTVADLMVKNHDFCKISFADPIKRFCMDIFAFSEEQLWGPSEKRSEPDKRYPKTVSSNQNDGLQNKESASYLSPREALQKIGTEGGRAAYDTVWVDYTIRKAKQLLLNKNLRYNKTVGIYSALHSDTDDNMPQVKGVVIPDCRFFDEISNVKKNKGIIIKVIRDNSGLKGNAAQHISETEQDKVPDDMFDYIINNNGTLKDLEDEVKRIVSFHI